MLPVEKNIPVPNRKAVRRLQAAEKKVLEQRREIRNLKRLLEAALGFIPLGTKYDTLVENIDAALHKDEL